MTTSKSLPVLVFGWWTLKTQCSCSSAIIRWGGGRQWSTSYSCSSIYCWNYRPNVQPWTSKTTFFLSWATLWHNFYIDTPNDQCVYAKIKKHLQEIHHDNQRNVRFLIEYGDPVIEESWVVLTFPDFVKSKMHKNQTMEKNFNVFSHHGPLKLTDPEYCSSSWNLKIEWEDGSRTFKPLDVIGADDPANCT